MRNRDYVVTLDLVETLRYKFNMKPVLENPELKRKIEDLQENFINKFKVLVPEDENLRIIKATELSEKLAKGVEDVKLQSRDSVVVSLDRVYFRKADFYLDVTREMDPLISVYNINTTNRYGSKNIEEQIKDLEIKLMSRVEKPKSGIILVDVGAVRGDMINDVIFDLKKKEIGVNNIVLGISSVEAKKALENRYGKKVTVLESYDLSQWLELRDMFLIDGIQAPDSEMKDGKKFISYADVIQWSGVPPKNYLALKELAKEANTSLIKTLESYGINTSIIGEPVKLNNPEKSRDKTKI
jgi:hypothetical protein